MSLNAHSSRSELLKAIWLEKQNRKSEADREVERRLIRADFYRYRQYLDPRLVDGWWQRDVAKHLQQFANDLLAGTAPMLVIQAPPQHGKSVQIIDLISWLAGRAPDLKTIYASFSERLGVRANLRLQRTFDSEKYHDLYPATRINASNVVTISGQYLRNREIIEYVGREGYFRNTTVRGPITGEGLDLAVIDDPIKGREEANSQLVRDKTWEWLMDDVFTRFSEKAGLLAILTRWHIDDPIGRLIEQEPRLKVLSYKAIATEDEEHRLKGQPLFPEHKSLEFLGRRRALMTLGSWEALYQQNPIVVGGSLFPVDRMLTVPNLPLPTEIETSVRYWDKAGTQDGGAYTAGVLMHKLYDGRYCIADVVRGQFGALEREKRIRQTAEDDGALVKVWIEQEPGSGGKESAERTIANLAGFIVAADRVTGSKETRAEPYAAQVQGGNICLVQGDWIRAFRTEHEQFPSGKYKDQVDAAAGAFAKIVAMYEGQGIMEFYRRLSADVSAKQLPPPQLTAENGGVTLFAPAGTSTVYLADGTRLSLGDDRSVIIRAADAASLRAAGFTDNPQP